MGKLNLICECGQRMVVPDAALGKAGLCPNCGREVTITRKNTRPYLRQSGGDGLLRQHQLAKPTSELKEKAWREFATAVDLYNVKRYAEAFAILDGLLERFPGNPHVELARDQCLTALHEPERPALEYHGKDVDTSNLNPDLVTRVILDKLCHGSSDTVRLHAADLAARILGMYTDTAPTPPPPGDTREEEKPADDHPVAVPPEELLRVLLAREEVQEAPPPQRPASRHRPSAPGNEEIP